VRYITIEAQNRGWGEIKMKNILNFFSKSFGD
jgi:hypothetical protein